MNSNYINNIKNDDDDNNDVKYDFITKRNLLEKEKILVYTMDWKRIGNFITMSGCYHKFNILKFNKTCHVVYNPPLDTILIRK